VRVRWHPLADARVACTVFGAVLFFVGLWTVHETTTLRALVAGAIPAAIVFGYAFRGFAALGEVVVWTASEVCLRVPEVGARVCLPLV